MSQSRPTQANLPKIAHKRGSGVLQKFISHKDTRVSGSASSIDLADHPHRMPRSPEDEPPLAKYRRISSCPINNCGTSTLATTDDSSTSYARSFSESLMHGYATPALAADLHLNRDKKNHLPIPARRLKQKNQDNSTTMRGFLRQQRFSSCVYLKDNFAENFKQRINRQRKQGDHERNLLLSEIEMLSRKRKGFYQAVLERIFEFQLTHSPVFLVECEEFKPLAEVQLQQYKNLIQGSPHEIIVFKFNLQIKRSDIHTLVGSNWLNDEVINFYMNLLTERSEQRAGQLPSVYAMNTFFLPRLMMSGHGGVKRWTRSIDLFSKDIIPVPVHCNGTHWCMAIIHMQTKKIRYYDSMGQRNQVVLDVLESYLQHESLDKRNQPFDTSGFLIENVPQVPQQANVSDCGVFSCMFAEYITREASINFSQKNMDYFRKKMILEIAEGKLWW